MKKLLFPALGLTFALLFIGSASNAQLEGDGSKPGLIITPTRVEIGSRERSASVTIANNGKVPGSYRIELVNKRMSEDGNIVDAPEDAKDPEFADKMIRLSPRRVTVDAGSNQNVRILLRKPKDLPDGEYRTHLSVMIVPDEVEPPKDEAGKDKLSISVRANYGVTIPIIINNGTLASTGQMGDIKYHPANTEKNEPPKVTFAITREGNKSLYGDIKVIYIDSKGSESVLKFMGGLAIYTPNPSRNFEVALDIPDNVKIGSGTIKVTYQEKEKAGGKIIAQNELKL